MSEGFRIVLDTNVLRAALWSSSGASFHLVSRPIPNLTEVRRPRDGDGGSGARCFRANADEEMAGASGSSFHL